ncbi:hypothetical protein COU60_04885 [Candidatus Pacearchaeota archaeon CG10_big_fil_rev_8_21_14_0_10_34_76]|nr:MAG: hypothetical protein COU60_04885 [Candidatus Pacearchaeota archaeon CG10_big_fil_rev_8_21_14_0_10_34_76]
MIIKVKVIPSSSYEKLEKISEGGYVAHLKEKAEDGKANRKLINLLAKEFGVDWRAIKIKNPKSRNKIVEIKNNGVK